MQDQAHCLSRRPPIYIMSYLTLEQWCSSCLQMRVFELASCIALLLGPLVDSKFVYVRHPFSIGVRDLAFTIVRRGAGERYQE